jgi:hypothetical protein
MRRLLVVLPFAVALLSGACISETERFATPEVSGPPEIRLDVVADHAEQFDTDLAERPAGSEEEQAAATYLLGTLQQNGYFVRLESVPVADLFRSTNLIAQPAGGDEPETVVVVPYGTGEGIAPNGTEVGLFLELARALNVRDPDHKVWFVAVGAEYSEEGGGNLGSRRLARFLLDEDEDPLVVQLNLDDEGFKAYGDLAGDANAIRRELLGEEGTIETDELMTPQPDVFKEAGFDRLYVVGEPELTGEVLLEFLAAAPE